MNHDQLHRQPQPSPEEKWQPPQTAVDAEQEQRPNKHFLRKAIAGGAIFLTAAGGVIFGIKQSGNGTPEQRPAATGAAPEHQQTAEHDPTKWNSENAPTTWAGKNGESHEYRGVDGAAKGIEIRDSEYPTAIDKTKRFLDLTNQLINYGHTPALKKQAEGYTSEDGDLTGTDAVTNDFAGPAYRQALMDPSSMSGNSFTSEMIGLNVGYVAENFDDSQKTPGVQQYRLKFVPDTSKTGNGLGIEVVENTQSGIQEAKLYYKYDDNSEEAGVSSDKKLTGWDVLDIKWLSKDGVSKITNIEAQNDPVG